MKIKELKIDGWYVTHDNEVVSSSLSFKKEGLEFLKSLWKEGHRGEYSLLYYGWDTLYAEDSILDWFKYQLKDAGISNITFNK